MNERIKELAEQAEINRFAYNQATMMNERVQEFDKEKFAELIVEEMLQTCEDHPAWTGRMISEEIKQHFGVEE